jgi:hypothetical protein
VQLLDLALDSLLAPGLPNFPLPDLHPKNGTCDQPQRTQRGKAATEWKKTESWPDRIIFDGSCGSAFCGPASNDTVSIPHDSVLP